MNAINYSTARKELAKTMERTCADHTPTIITKSGTCAVVMIALEDYQAMEETAYLLSSPRNAARLAKSLKSAQRGQAKSVSFKKLEEITDDAKTNVHA